MPRKAQSDSDNEKQSRPKEIFRISVEIFDNGAIDYTLKQWYLNEETGKRKQLIYDSPSKYKKAIEQDLGTNTDKLATWILEGLGINANEFARSIVDSTRDYDQDDYDKAEEIMESIEDAEAGEDLP